MHDGPVSPPEALSGRRLITRRHSFPSARDEGVIGFKVLRGDRRSLNGETQFELGAVHALPGCRKALTPTVWGFHFAPTPLECYVRDDTRNMTSDLRCGFAYVEVMAVGRVKRDSELIVTDKLLVLREIPEDRWLRMCTGTLTLQDGTRSRYLNGLLHDDDVTGDPAVVCPDGTTARYTMGMLHSPDDLPSIVYPDGVMMWHEWGRKSRRGDRPAVDYSGQASDCPEGFMRSWWCRGFLHRGGGRPARESLDGTTTEWYLWGDLHNEEGPARVVVAHADGGGVRVTQEWYEKGIFLRRKERVVCRA